MAASQRALMTALPLLVRVAVRVLAGRDDTESMLADLEEEFAERRRREGYRSARRWLWAQALRSAAPLGARRLRRAARLLTGGGSMLHRGLALDLRHATRRLVRAPVFLSLVVGTLGLGIAATTIIFSLADAIWLKPLPYADPESLVFISDVHDKTGLDSPASAPELDEVRTGTMSFTDLAGYNYGAHVARIAGEPVRVVAYRVTPSLFPLLGVSAALGRTFAVTDAGTPVVVLSDTTWRTRFQRDPGVVGKFLLLDGSPYTVIGVMPSAFHFPLELESEIWTPTAYGGVSDRSSRFVELIARLRPGISLARANQDLATFAARLAKTEPGSNAGWTTRAQSVSRQTTGAYRAAFGTLLGMVGLFLFVGSANLASLLISRNLARRSELVLALSLGASRGRLIRELLIESSLLSAAGGLAGLLVARQAISVVAAFLPAWTPRLADVAVNPTVLAFAVAVVTATAILCTILPAIGLRSLSLRAALTGARDGGPASRHSEHALVIVEVALATILLLGAGLMVRSFVGLLDRDRGYAPTGVLALNVTLPPSDQRWASNVARAAAFEDILATVGHVPGVTRVGATAGFPGSPLGYLGGGLVHPVDQPSMQVAAGLHDATPEYFKAMGVPLIRGRAFQPTDTATAPCVAIVNETLENQLWPGGRSIGQRMSLPPGAVVPSDACEVVGVAGDMHMGIKHTAEVFVPLRRTTAYWIDLVVRTNGDPAALSDAVRRVLRAWSPDLLIENVSSLNDIIWQTYGLQRAQSLLTALVAGLAGLMAAVGLYALLAQHVAQRRKEMGIRLALGSSPGRLFWTVFRRGLVLSSIGTAAGLGASFILIRVLRDQVFGLQAVNPPVVGAVVAGLAGLTSVVIWWSARRVVRIDPLEAIRD